MIQNDYKTYKLSELCSKITDGSHFSPKSSFKGSNLIATVRNMTEYGFNLQQCKRISDEDYNELVRNGCKPEKGDVIFSKDGTIGLVQYIKDNIELVLLSSIAIFKPNCKLINGQFLSYILKNPSTKKNIQDNYVSGSALPRIVLKDFKKLELNIPVNLEVQSRIASILSCLDNKIELNLQMNKTLEAVAQAIFKEWFVNFRFPEFDGELVHGMPKGWRNGRLGEDFKLVMGQSPPGESYNEIGEGTVFYQGRTDFGFRFPEKRMFTTAPMRMAKELDTLVSVRAPVGDINMAMEDCCIGRGLSAVMHGSGAYSYTYYAMKHIENIFKGFEGEGTVFGSINKTNFENISMIVPDRAVVGEFERFVNPIDKKIFINSSEIGTLTRIRDILLPKLMTGKIRVA